MVAESGKEMRVLLSPVPLAQTILDPEEASQRDMGTVIIVVQSLICVGVFVTPWTAGH